MGRWETGFVACDSWLGSFCAVRSEYWVKNKQHGLKPILQLCFGIIQTKPNWYAQHSLLLDRRMRNVKQSQSVRAEFCVPSVAKQSQSDFVRDFAAAGFIRAVFTYGISGVKRIVYRVRKTKPICQQQCQEILNKTKGQILHQGTYLFI